MNLSLYRCLLRVLASIRADVIVNSVRDDMRPTDVPA